MRPSKRAVRVGDVILREIATILLEKTKDPRVRGVTLTGIHLSNDLKSARVFFSALGGADDIRRAQSGVDSAKGFVKREIAARMELRYVPDISFVHDPTLQNADRLEALFAEIRKEEER
ncbi:MAG: 30S ribosome-binding factor RbfA [Deltaproteobacteria bacterium]|jgi:ribosome-binding factor A